jgi:uncharacterized membrane protein
MGFPLRTLSWALVTIVCVAALLLSIFRPGAAAPILGAVLFALYVGLVTEALLDVTSRDDLSLRQRMGWLALVILVLPLVPVMAGAYFLLGRRQTALLVGGPRERRPEPWAGRVPHRRYSIMRWTRRG